jgi:hypothetical protein
VNIAYRLTVAALGMGSAATSAHAENDANSWMPWNAKNSSTDRPASAERHVRAAQRPEPAARAVPPAPRLVTITRPETRTVARYEPAERATTHSDTSGLGPRPTQWCGWYMRSLRGGGPEFNVAANWRNYGSSAQPQVGAVVVWDHHVGLITGRTESGEWIVKSGNWSNRVHEGPRSIAGATIRI